MAMCQYKVRVLIRYNSKVVVTFSINLFFACLELVNECHDSEKDYIPGETYIKGNCTQKCSCNEVRYVGHVEQCVPLCPSMPPKCLWGTITEFYQEDIDGSECSCRKCVSGLLLHLLIFSIRR